MLLSRLVAELGLLILRSVVALMVLLKVVGVVVIVLLVASMDTATAATVRLMMLAFRRELHIACVLGAELRNRFALHLLHGSLVRNEEWLC